MTSYDVTFSTISIHALRGEGDTCRSDLMVSLQKISIHALRGEGDAVSCQSDAVLKAFQSTPSVGRATLFRSRKIPFLRISIHALRGEGDAYSGGTLNIPVYISIHALRGEGDIMRM